MNKILISSCLLGEAVRYDGNHQLIDHKILKLWLAQDRVVSFCPEVAGGMSIPRIAAEIVGGDGIDVLDGKASVIDKSGNNVSMLFISGANQALTICRQYNIQVAILSQRSPSCGDNTIYDGTFSRTTRPGAGVTAALLIRNGIKVFNQTAFDEAAKYLQD